MILFFKTFSLVWLLVVACCCAAGAARRRCGISIRRRGRVSGHRNVKRSGADGIRSMPATMKQCGGVWREGRKGAVEKTVAVLAALQESPRNLSILRPPQGRQVAVLGMERGAGKHCLKDAGAVRFEWIVFGSVFRAVAHQQTLSNMVQLLVATIPSQVVQFQCAFGPLWKT
jgi:hypothetical protein